MSFVLKWPSGTTSGRDWYRKENDAPAIIRMFSGELERVPPAERPLTTATFSAAIRKAGGGEAWVRLASWFGTEPVETLFQAARVAWRSRLEEDDEAGAVVDDDVSNS